ncbi:MAG TPA: hypothetical protein VGH02_16420 [Rhizomicrobium sp.]|jgi:hypothetical protein
MKLVYGLSAALLGTTLLAGAANAQNNNDNPRSHPHFSTHDSARDHDDTVSGNSASTGGANAAVAANGAPRSWPHGANGGHPMNAPHAHWNATNLRDHNVSHFSAQDRDTWQHGHWQHGRHHGRNGWWWNSGGTWFFYDQPVYPYPGYVSDDYYADDYYGDDDGYAVQGYGPGDGGYAWYYCNNPAGYYPYVKSCRGPWRAVTPTPPADQQGYDQGPNGDNDDQGPPPGYNDDRGPPPGYDRGDQFNGPDQGPPPGYNDNRNGPPGYNDDRGPPPDTNSGPDDDDNGPPPPPR